MDFRDRHLEFWASFSDGHPTERNSKTLTYHQWCVMPARRALVTHSPYRLPDTCTLTFLKMSDIAARLISDFVFTRFALKQQL